MAPACPSSVLFRLPSTPLLPLLCRPCSEQRIVGVCCLVGSGVCVGRDTGLLGFIVPFRDNRNLHVTTGQSPRRRRPPPDRHSLVLFAPDPRFSDLSCELNGMSRLSSLWARLWTQTRRGRKGPSLQTAGPSTAWREPGMSSDCLLSNVFKMWLSEALITVYVLQICCSPGFLSYIINKVYR